MALIPTNLSHTEALETSELKDPFYSGVLTLKTGVGVLDSYYWTPPQYPAEFINDILTGTSAEIAHKYNQMGEIDLCPEDDNVERKIYTINGIPFFCIDTKFMDDTEVGRYIIQF